MPASVNLSIIFRNENEADPHHRPLAEEAGAKVAGMAAKKGRNAGSKPSNAPPGEESGPVSTRPRLPAGRSRPARILLALLVLLVSGALSFGGFRLVSLLRERERLERDLEVARREARAVFQARLERERELSLQLRALQEERERRLARARLAARERQRLADRLALAEQRITAVTAELEAARAFAASVEADSRDRQLSMRRLVREKAALEGELAALRSRLSKALVERDMARRVEKGLRWRIDMLQSRVAEVENSRATSMIWIREWIGKHLAAIEQVLAEAGVDPRRLLERAGDDLPAGIGGPFELPTEDAPAALPAIEGSDLSRSVVRLQAAQRLIAAMPLTSPLDSYRITSPYGLRKDPVTGRRAMHKGIDMAAPWNARVLSAAPGRVIRAGRNDAYGLMVEIDHGMGIVTRYAHMKKLLVKRGQKVDFRQPVGIVGNTGRSTGPHLHYEIRIDGEPLDPAGFIAAGRNLTTVFKG